MAAERQDSLELIIRPLSFDRPLVAVGKYDMEYRPSELLRHQSFPLLANLPWQREMCLLPNILDLASFYGGFYPKILDAPVEDRLFCQHCQNRR
jgi:hypothetical protein